MVGEVLDLIRELAEDGMTYREILEWYYTGTEVGVIG